MNLGPSFVAQVQNILADHFQGAQIDVDRFNGAKRICGHIVWQGFDDIEHMDRQHRIYAALRQGLGPEAIHISIILAYSPHEWAVMHEDE